MSCEQENPEKQPLSFTEIKKPPALLGAIAGGYGIPSLAGGERGKKLIPPCGGKASA
jgi:hypothetical protein